MGPPIGKKVARKSGKGIKWNERIRRMRRI
jgi:hypothetical protein